jgi:hypothetical protein
VSAETIYVDVERIGTISPGQRWSPVIGPLAQRFLSKVVYHREDVESEALQILARCTRPGELDRRAGLVVGYVQSGKTTSFTAVSALAADNGYGIVIILGGTSTPLLDQTRARVKKDLDLSDSDAYRRWIHVESPQPGSNEAQRLFAALATQLDRDADADEKVPVLVTVMKQHVHMENLALVLDELNGQLALAEISALIIDDEADQATPNLKRGQGESATYSRLRRIRGALQSHTLLQYTATPQAPLLVSIADEISPEFVCTLTPGHGYTGGKFFFVDHHDEFVRHISSDDLAVIDSESDIPPRSLLLAFSTYVLGCAVARHRGELNPAQRSMLVHPSQKTLPQARFVNWLRSTRDHWLQSLALDTEDDDRRDHLATVWLPAWLELKLTVTDLPSLEELLPRCSRVLTNVIFEEVNATSSGTSEVAWAKGPYWVLVGGQLLDRGFTVEGLTVTYMPRGMGVGNADTLQQRARFFGYKENYSAYCRLFLDASVDHAFTSYVRHEEALRGELEDVARDGQSLKDWKRIFFLDKSLKLTRQGVIRLPLITPRFAEGWFSQRDFGDASPDLLIDNFETVSEFVASHTWHEFEEKSGPDLIQRHVITETTISDVLAGLLMPFITWGDDVASFTALRALMDEAGEDLPCAVVRMSAHLPEGTRRRRSLLDGRIKNLFQGRNPKSGSASYLGDRKVHRDDIITIQIHSCDLAEDDGTDEGSRVMLVNVPVIAAWIPSDLVERILVEA